MRSISHHRETTCSFAGRIRSVSLFLLALLLAAVPLRGAEVAEDYLVDVWTSERGLPDSSVAAIAQTPEGYLWIGTYNGLARFDGVRFVTFDPLNTPALAHAGVRKLSVDDRGTLWINTFDGSLTSLRNGVFAREWTGVEGQIRSPDITLLSSESNQVTFLFRSGELRRKSQDAAPGTGWEVLTSTNRAVGALCVADGQGTIWYRGSDYRLFRLQGTNFEPVLPTLGLVGNWVNCMTVDSKGRLWVGTDKQIAMWDGKSFQSVTPTNGAPEVQVGFLSVTDDGRIWAGVDNQLRQAEGRRWLLESVATTNVFTRMVGRMGGREDHRGGIWLYDYGLGLSHLSSDGKMRRFGVADGFAGDRVNCFLEDREGNWWMGLDAAGLVRIRERRFQTLGEGRAIPAAPVRSICEEPNGTVWVGMSGEGLGRWQAGAFTNLAVPGTSGKGFVFSVCPDTVGRLWLSASSGSENLHVYESNEIKQVSLAIRGIKTILTDKAGRVWVGTMAGLYVKSDMTSSESNAFRLFEGSSNKNVRALAEDKQGNIWFGCNDGTLARISRNILTEVRPTDGKPKQPVWTLLAEDDGTVWAGTFKGGLLRVRDNQFARFDINEALPNNIICQILADDAGNLWLGSYQGIFRVAKSALNDFADGKAESVAVTTFGRSDGLPSLDCSGGYQPAAWHGQDGRLWFTTLKGAVSVRPHEIRANRLPPTVVIEEITIDGKVLDMTAITTNKTNFEGATYDRGAKRLKVAPGRHRFEFRYTGLSLVSPGRVQFQHRLEGADTDWVKAGTRRIAEYSLLPSGVYRFQVVAWNSDGYRNDKGDFLTLEIQPYFYETIWFRILMGLAGAGLIAGGVWYSATRRLRRKLEKLSRQQALERERARIAKDIHDDLGASLTLIARLGHLARQEQAVERIEKMESTARQAVKSLDEIVWAVNPRNDTLAHLIDYTGQFATDYLYAAGVRCLLDVPEQVPVMEVPSNVRHNVFLVVKEALQNIVKHGHATEAWLRIRIADAHLEIVLEDNGRGFDAAPDNALADGLWNMRQRMQEIGGKCEINSHVGRGTQITIQTPWASD